jgi:hypothetical protein
MSPDPHDVAVLRPMLPVLTAWIDQTLAQHRDSARPVAHYAFPRLALFFGPEVLSSAKVVALERVPFPPLSQWGLTELASLESGEAAGITFRDTYFVQAAAAHEESLHFHELVHVVQWKLLGSERFLMSYAAGILAHGYRDSPLEALAFRLQARFERGAAPESMELRIREALEVA